MTLVVDHQAHWYPEAHLAALSGDSWPRATELPDGGYRYEAAPGIAFVMGPGHLDLDLALADMDAHGIDVMVCSPAPLGDVQGLAADRAAALCRSLNDETARAQNLHPTRLAGLAMLPLGQPDAAIAELDRAVGGLGLRGVCVISSDRARPLTQPGAVPLLKRIESLGVPVFLHPAFRSLTADVGYPPVIDVALGWLSDTSALALDLIVSGVLEHVPGLTVVHPHLGGVVPFLRGRIGALTARLPLARPFDEVLRTQFMVDCANNTPGAMALAAATYGWDRIVFATDYPWVPRGVTDAYLAGELQVQQQAAMKRTHAVRSPAT